jgi:hypothetical protein
LQAFDFASHRRLSGDIQIMPFKEQFAKVRVIMVKNQIPPTNERVMQLRSSLLNGSGDSLKLLDNLEENPICSVSFDGDVPCIVVTWKDYATSAQLRYVHECVLDLLVKHGVHKILRDDTALPAIHAENQVWIAKDWMPRAMAAGLRAAADKCSNWHFANVSISKIHSIAPAGLALRSFDSLAEARQWLKAF